jgi:hypothetical protein
MRPARSAIPAPPELEPSTEPAPAALAGKARWPSSARFLYRLMKSNTIASTSASPAAPPTTPPAIVPAGATASSLLSFDAAALVLVMPFDVAVAPSPAAPTNPVPSDSSEETGVDSGDAWVDVAASVENTVERKVDRSLKIVLTDPLAEVLLADVSLEGVSLAEEDAARLLVLLVADGETVAVCPSESVVVNDSLDRVIVSTSPFD